MPRRKTDRIWEQRIFALKGQEPDLSAEAMARRFEEEQGGMGHWPAARTIRRILDEEWSKLTPDQRREYEYFRWPESMEDGSLPWEASAAGLELLRAFSRLRRPPVRLARWFWRVTQAAPGAGIPARLQAAAQLAIEEALGTTQERRAVEWFLAFQPWRSEEDRAEYEDAQQSTSCEPIAPFTNTTFTIGESQDIDVERAFDIVYPGLGATVVQFFLQKNVEGITEEELARRIRELSGEDIDVERAFDIMRPGLGSITVQLRRALTTTDPSIKANMLEELALRMEELRKEAEGGEAKSE